MISQKAVKQFLNRPTQSFDWLKKQSLQQLQDEFNNMSPPPDLNGVKLWQHQYACLLLLIELKRFMLFIDLGGGKTLMTLQLIRYRKQCGETPRAIVFVPYITSVETWVEEVAKHAADLHVVPLVGTGDSIRDRLTGGGDLFVVCYQSAVAMASEEVKVKGKTKWQLTSKQVREYFAGFDMIVMDEIHKCKSASSLTYRMCRAISSTCEYALGLTGTPFGRDLEDLWPQFNLVDFGETLGNTFGLYREAFFNQHINYWGGYEYKFKKRMLPDLKRMVKHGSIHYGINEFADMEPKQYIVKTVPLPIASVGYVEKALKALDAAHGKGRYQVVESNYMQLRQLASGFLTLKGVDTQRVQIKFDDNPKLEALEELVSSMPHGTKGVVFHHFVYTSQLISEKLAAMGIKHARIWGGAKDPIGELRKFKDSPSCQLLVINWKSGSSSLNLQNANYMFVFEQPDSPIDRTQGEGRLWRPGQQNRVFIYDLLCKGSLDSRMLKANRAGKELLKELLK